jgi:DNA-binding MarR family transcriptional regulator
MGIAVTSRSPNSGDSDQPVVVAAPGGQRGAVGASLPAAENAAAGVGVDPIGDHVSDHAIDTLDRVFRRIRRSMIKPPQTQVAMPSLGRPVDLATLMACDTLAELHESGQDASVKDLATAMELDHSTVSRLVGENKVEGLVQRSVDPADRRRTQLQLTELGERVVADFRHMQRFVARTVMADWPASDVQELTRLLTQLADCSTNLSASMADLVREEFQSAGFRHAAPNAHGGRPAGKLRTHWLNCCGPSVDNS